MYNHKCQEASDCLQNGVLYDKEAVFPTIITDVVGTHIK